MIFLCLRDRRDTIITLFKDKVVLIHAWVVTERWGGGGDETVVVYHPAKSVYIFNLSLR